jgi:hypothetical protein
MLDCEAQDIIIDWKFYNIGQEWEKQGKGNFYNPIENQLLGIDLFPDSIKSDQSIF